LTSAPTACDSLDFAPGDAATFVTDTNGGGSGGATTQTRTHNRRKRFTSISGMTTPTYDNNGNLLTDGAGKTFKHDAWDRLVTEGNGVENVRYTYDARGYRTERMAGGVSTYYHYTHDWQLIEERGVGSGPGRTGGGSRSSATWATWPASAAACRTRRRGSGASGACATGSMPNS
jgi:hypothetical protein